MTSRILITLAAATIGVVLSIAPAAAREWQERDYWWEKSGNTGFCGYSDEYSYPGIVSCGCGCGGGSYGYGHRRHNARHRDGDEERSYGRGRHGRGGGHGDRHRGEWT